MDFTPNINTLSILVLAAAILYSQWRTGAKQVGAEVIANYKALVEQKNEHLNQTKQELATFKTEMANMEKGLIAKIAKMEGALGEKDKQLEMLNKILANRNPELEKVLGEIGKGLGEIRNFMSQLTLKNDEQTVMLQEATKH